SWRRSSSLRVNRGEALPQNWQGFLKITASEAILRQGPIAAYSASSREVNGPRASLCFLMTRTQFFWISGTAMICLRMQLVSHDLLRRKRRVKNDVTGRRIGGSARLLC